jgi:hypothetical protein
MFDKVVAAVTPPESDQARREARAKAQAAAGPQDWLGMALRHHEQIEQGFDAVRTAQGPARHAALRELALVLNGHSIAEELVLYPMLIQENEKRHATSAYTQQTATKVQMAELERIDPSSQEFLDKLEHVRGAVLHHMYEEEGTWFMELLDKVPREEHVRLTERFTEEFERYTGGGMPGGATAAGIGALASERMSTGAPGSRLQ